MSTDLVPVTRPVRPGPSPYLPAVRLAFALLVLAQLGLVVFLAWEPPFDGSIAYDDIAGLGATYWPMNALLGGPAFALTSVTTSLFLVLLGPGRGMTLTLVGATLNLLGGLVFALVVTAEVLPFAWALHGPRPEEQVGALADPLTGYVPWILLPMAVVALGALLALTGAALSGGLPWWVAGVAVLLVVLVFVVPADLPGAFSVDVAQRALWVYVGWRGLRAVSGRG